MKHHTEKLMHQLPAGHLIVSESGIQSKAELDYLAALGVHAVLVGEALMKEKNPGEALKALIG